MSGIVRLNISTILSAVGLAMLGSVTATADDPAAVCKKSPAAYQRSIETSENTVVVDVRTDLEFADGHLPEAIRIGIEDDDFARQFEKLPKDRPVHVYCGSGFRSERAAIRIAELGFKNVIDLEGGIKAWKDAGFPVVKP